MNTYEVQRGGEPTQTVQGYNVQNALDKLGIPYGDINHRDGKQYRGRYFAYSSNGRIVWIEWVEKRDRWKSNN